MRQLLILFLMILISSCTNSDTEKLQTEMQQLKETHKMTTEIAINSKASVKAFFKALEDENADAIANLFAEDAQHINPYHSGLFPEGANGKEAIKSYWAPVFPNFDSMTFPIEELYAMEDPNMVFVKYSGHIKLKNNAGVYSNDYYSTFKFNSEGKITEYVEIFNPIIAARGFGLIDKIK
ncbi:nuclear transport factor 2 family protein [Winogradskyella sp.]